MSATTKTVLLCDEWRCDEYVELWGIVQSAVRDAERMGWSFVTFECYGLRTYCPWHSHLGKFVDECDEWLRR